ncbi:hypothetical protein CPSG_07874 [Coccidioides posadasii str. Silveira]|uniref:Uncharacterized protein n=1 Tax=Coccidioides posadasii (strain RMSCC 757 / Silveira) TaxID=443226 RepID=E9DE83_COCPS|nr:hypothetical protein CPSG_07874 [Coccidioides posadasii str. Silveira]
MLPLPSLSLLPPLPPLAHPIVLFSPFPSAASQIPHPSLLGGAYALRCLTHCIASPIVTLDPQEKESDQPCYRLPLLPSILLIFCDLIIFNLLISNQYCHWTGHSLITSVQ